MRAADFSRGVFFSAKFACAPAGYGKRKSTPRADFSPLPKFFRSGNLAFFQIIRLRLKFYGKNANFSGRVFVGARIFHSLYERLRYRNAIAHFRLGRRKEIRL